MGVGDCGYTVDIPESVAFGKFVLWKSVTADCHHSFDFIFKLYL